MGGCHIGPIGRISLTLSAAVGLDSLLELIYEETHNIFRYCAVKEKKGEADCEIQNREGAKRNHSKHCVPQSHR